MPTLFRPACDLYYETTGDGPAIVFAHGGGGNHLSWWQQAPIFAEAYRCVVFDHRGWGRSAEREGGPGARAFVDDLIALLDELEIERTALVAQSMGGWTCLGAAVQHPERVSALLMCGTTGGLTTPAVASVAGTRERIRRQGLANLAYHPNLRDRDPALAFLYDEIMALNPPLNQNVIDLMAELAPDPQAVAALPMPILWIVGSADPLMPPEVIRAARDHVPGSSYFEAADTGHSVYFERPVEFNMQLNSFLVEAGWGDSVF